VQSETFDTTDPVAASLLAAAAWRIDPGNPLARESLLDAYAQPDHAVLNADSGGRVYGAAFSPDGTLLATAGADGKVRLRDVATRSQIGAPITVPGSAGGGGLGGVAFSPDGKVLATAGSDGTVLRWDVAFPGNLLDAVCAIAGRSLTRQEWSVYVQSEPFQQVCP